MYITWNQGVLKQHRARNKEVSRSLLSWMYLKAYHHRSPQLQANGDMQWSLAVTFRCCYSMQAKKKQYDLQQIWSYLCCFSGMNGNTIMHSHLQEPADKNEIVLACPEILRDFPRAYNRPCLLVSTVTFRQIFRRAEEYNICSCLDIVHAKSGWFPRIVQKTHQLSATFYCYSLVITQWIILLQAPARPWINCPICQWHGVHSNEIIVDFLTLRSTHYTSANIIQCGQVHVTLWVKPPKTPSRLDLRWRSTPKIGEGHPTFNGASI